MKLKINEIYYSIQGESSYMGKPCIFIRLTYCNLRCTYCDSEYTFHEGNDMSIDDIMTSLHSNLEEVLTISLGPFIDKFNKCNNQINIVSDVLKQLPEYQRKLYKSIIQQELTDDVKKLAEGDEVKFSVEEKQNILINDYKTLWENLWLVKEIKNKKEYNDLETKFLKLKTGYYNHKLKKRINLNDS